MKNVKSITALLLTFILSASLIPIFASEATDNYYDVNFDNGTFLNSASGLSLNVAAGTAAIDYPYDALKGSKVIRYTLPNTSPFVLREQNFNVSNLDTDKKVMWYELSVKFEGNVSDIDLRATAAIFDINKDGTLYFSSLYDAQGAYGPAILAPVTILPDKWYRIKVAVDFADSVLIGEKKHPKFYAWVNGELLALSNETCSFIWSSTIAASKTSASQLNIYTAASKAGDAFCLDDLKIYSSNVPVKFSKNAPELKPDTIYSMDYESFSAFDSAGFRISDTDTESGVNITDTNEHFYRYTGGKSSEDFRYADLMLYNENAGDFFPDAVFQADYRIGNNNTENLLISFRDINARSETPIYIAPDGYIYHKKTNTKVSQSINCKNNWVNIAIAFHYFADSSPTYDIYLNSEKILNNIAFSSASADSTIYFVRHFFENLPASGNYLDIDNIWVYKNTEYYDPIYLEGVGGEHLTPAKPWQYEIDESDFSPDMSSFTLVTETPLENPTLRLTDYSEAKREYENALCFAGGTCNLWIKNAKYFSKYQTLIENESFLVAAPVLASLTNKTLLQTGETAKIGNVTANAGNSYITVDGEKIDTEVPVKNFSGVIYIPLKEFAIHGMKKWYGVSNLGFACIAKDARDIHFKIDAKRPNLHTVGNTSHMMAYLLLDLPNKSALSALFSKNKPSKRPYSAGTDAEFSALKKLVLSDITAKEYSDAVIQNADAICAKVYTASDAENVQASPVFGSNEPWTLYWAYYMTKDVKYVQKAEELALLMCSLSHWSSSFHFLQTSQGLIGASSFYDLFYNEFSENTKDKLASAIINKGLIPANEYYEGSKVGIQHDWCTRCTNWNAVPNSGIIIASATLLGENYDDALMLKSLERAFVSLGYFMPYFAPNGGGGEGIGYTSFTLSYLCPMIDTLERVFKTDFGLCDYPGFKNAGNFICDSLSGNRHFALNDDSTQGTTAPDMSLWFAKRYNLPALSDFVISYYEKYGQNKAAYSSGILKYYIPSDISYKTEFPLDKVYQGTELAFSRDTYDKNATFLGVHAGYNHISHGRYDYGTFRFDAFGKRFASSTGCDDYSLSGIGNFAYNSMYYVIRAEGHNVYVVNPDEKPGQNRYTHGQIKIKEQKEKGIIYTLDMLPAYSAYVKSAQRGYMLTNDRKVLVIQDEITPYSGKEDEFYWFWHTYADIEIDNSINTAVLTIDNKKVKLYFDSNVEISLSKSGAQPLSTSPNPEGQLKNEELSSINKITARFKGNGGPIIFRVIAEPMGQQYVRSALTPISDWTIPDGSTSDEFYKKAETITLNGVELSDFSPDIYDYTIYYPSAEIPVLSAVSNGNVTITQAQYDGDTAVVKIENDEIPGNYKIYTVTLLSRDSALGNVTTYVDCDFSTHPDLLYEKSEDNFFIYHSKGGSPSFETDVQRNSRVLRYNIKSAEKSGAEFDKTALVHLDQNLKISDTTPPGAIVYEFSFKTDKFARLSTLIFNTTAIETDREGNIYAVYGNNILRRIGSYKPHEWVNIKIIYENVYKYWGLHPRMFVYVNDSTHAQILDSFDSSAWEATQLHNMPSLSTKKVRFSLFANEKEDVNFYIDDVLLYTTQNQAYGVLDIGKDLVGTKVTSDSFTVFKNNLTKRNEIITNKNTTIKELLENINYSSQRLVFCKDGALIAPEEFDSMRADGISLYVMGQSCRLLKAYDIVSQDCVRSSFSLTKNETNSGCLSKDLTSGDRIYAQAKINSVSSDLSEKTVVFALYDKNKLIDFTISPVLIGKNEVTLNTTQEPLTIPDSFSELSLKAFIWDSCDKAMPISDMHIFK